MPRCFDSDAFYVALDRKRRSHRMSWRDVAGENECSASIFTRLGQGKTPSAEHYAKLCGWLGIEAPFTREAS